MFGLQAHRATLGLLRGIRQARGRNSKPKKTQETIRLPLRSYSWLEARGGTVVKTLQLIGRGGDRGRPGGIVIGVVSDMEIPSQRAGG